MHFRTESLIHLTGERVSTTAPVNRSREPHIEHPKDHSGASSNSALSVQRFALWLLLALRIVAQFEAKVTCAYRIRPWPLGCALSFTHCPARSTATATATPLSHTAHTMASNSAPKVEQQAPKEEIVPQAGNVDTPDINWESEIQLVSSLAKLQELERKVRPSIPNDFQSSFVSF